MTTIALAAAGTGGHVYPALNVAGALVRAGVAASEIVFFGGTRLEATAVPAAGYELVELPLQGLERSLTTRNLRIPFRLVAAARAAREVMRRRGVGALAAFGGYVTLPTAWAARRLRLPVMLQEQNAVPGLANRVAARWAHTVYHGFPAGAERLPGPVVGNPLRPELDGFQRAALTQAARRRYGFVDDRPVLGVVGGSLGAQALNQAVAGLVAGWSGPPLGVVHIAGRGHADGLAGRPAAGGVEWRVLPFEAEMQYFYAVTNLAVSRSSGVSTSELAATGTPAVLVPRSATRADHYEANAADLTAVGGALRLPESELSRLPDVVASLVGDPARLGSMAAAAASRARTGAADRIAADLIEAAGG